MVFSNKGILGKCGHAPGFRDCHVSSWGAKDAELVWRNGFSGTMAFFTEQMGMPALVAYPVIIGEFLGNLALLIGFLTRFTSASLALIMVGAMTMIHWQHGFFMNWFGQQAGEGYEYYLLAIGLCLSLVMTGGGKFSVDAAIARRLKS